MALKFSLDELPDDLPDALRGLYKETESGKFVLDVEGVAPKEKINEFRATNVNLMKERDALAKALQEKGATAEDLEAAIAKHQQELDEARGREREATKKLRQVVLRNTLTATALAQGVLPSALDDVMSRASDVFDIDDNGQLTGREGVNADTKKWFDDLKAGAGHLFATSSGGGAPGSLRVTEPQRRIKYRSDLGDAAARAAFIRQFGAEKYLSLPPAPGVDAAGAVRVKKESDLRREQAQEYARRNGLSL